MAIISAIFVQILSQKPESLVGVWLSENGTEMLEFKDDGALRWHQTYTSEVVETNFISDEHFNYKIEHKRPDFPLSITDFFYNLIFSENRLDFMKYCMKFVDEKYYLIIYTNHRLDNPIRISFSGNTLKFYDSDDGEDGRVYFRYLSN